MSELGAIPPVYEISPITSIPPSLTVRTFLVPISIIASPFVSGFLKNIWSIGPANCVCVILHFSKKLSILPNTLNSGVPVAPISTSKSPSDVNLPIVLTVSLNTVGLFSVIPATSLKFINISDAVGSALRFD